MTATVTGWGTLVKDGPTPNVLQKVKYFYAYVNILISVSFAKMTIGC